MTETSTIRREITLKELQALFSVLGRLDEQNLYVEIDPTDSAHPQGKIMRGNREVVETDGSELTTEQTMTHVIVCDLLWLAREDAQRKRILEGDYELSELALPENVTVLEDHLAIDHLSHLRSEKTSLRNFRTHSDKLCSSLFQLAVADLDFYHDEVTNPLVREMGAETLPVPKLAEKVIVVPVLRAGLAMMTPAMQALPKSKIGVLGLKRDEQARAHWYYESLPEITADSVVIVTDPMLATGGTLLEAIDKINSGPVKPKEIRIVCVVAAPEGVAVINQKYDNVKIFTGAVDSHLNSHAYIVPGLGDYGDRYFGTDPEPGHSIA